MVRPLQRGRERQTQREGKRGRDRQTQREGKEREGGETGTWEGRQARTDCLKGQERMGRDKRGYTSLTPEGKMIVKFKYISWWLFKIGT